jgi:hypothetical protein
MAAPPPPQTGWTAHGAAAGAAAVTGAAQLGLGYGLGVVAWPAGPTVDDSVWLGSLGWATWIAASATVFGAVLAVRLLSRPGGPWRFTLAVAAAVGALLPLALIALPARMAVRQDTVAPATIAAGYAAVGILLGTAIAYWAVVSRPVAANLIGTAVWLWSLAAAAVIAELINHRASATYLTSWQFADPGGVTRYGTIHWLGALLTLAITLIIGVLAAWPAVRRGDLGLGAAVSGASGPVLVAAAFFVLAPRLTDPLGTLGSAYLIAPYAVLTGLAGSAMTVAIGRRLAEGHAEQSRAEQSSRLPTDHQGERSAGGPDAVSEPDGHGGDETGGYAPARPRSTVTPPPASPPIAQINPPLSPPGSAARPAVARKLAGTNARAARPASAPEATVPADSTQSAGTD